MSTDAAQPQITPKAADELGRLVGHIATVPAAQLLWECRLTEAERRQLGGDFGDSYRRLGTIGMWREVRGGSRTEALVAIAQELGLATPQDVAWLRREIGAGDETAPAQQRPRWDPARGQLWLGDDLIRALRVTREPTNIFRIVDAFAKAGWPAQIRDPLPGGSDQQRLHETVRSLNAGLSGIRFRVQAGGRRVTWETR